MEQVGDAQLCGGSRCEEVDKHVGHARLGAVDGGAPARCGRRTRAAVTRRMGATTCRTVAAVCGTLADDAWRSINRLGRMDRFGHTGAHVGVWAVGPNHNGGRHGAHLTGVGALRINNID
jgi:hypothetical protein